MATPEAEADASDDASDNDQSPQVVPRPRSSAPASQPLLADDASDQWPPAAERPRSSAPVSQPLLTDDVVALQQVRSSAKASAPNRASAAAESTPFRSKGAVAVRPSLGSLPTADNLSSPTAQAAQRKLTMKSVTPAAKQRDAGVENTAPAAEIDYANASTSTKEVTGVSTRQKSAKSTERRQQLNASQP
jgi:hypothetical protein